MSLHPDLAKLVCHPDHERYEFTPEQFTEACLAVARAERERCVAYLTKTRVGIQVILDLAALPDPDWAFAGHQVGCMCPRCSAVG